MARSAFRDSHASMFADDILDYIREFELDDEQAHSFVELVSEYAHGMITPPLTAEDIAYERAQASEKWQRMGGGGL